MRTFLVILVLLSLSLLVDAQPIYRRGGFQFAFTSDSALTSDYYYAAPKEGKKLGFSVPLLIEGGLRSASGNSIAGGRLSLFPTWGLQTEHWKAEAYLGFSTEYNPLYNVGSSLGFGEKPLKSDSSGQSTFSPGFVLNYKPNKHFSFAGGYDKNFIGEGYYSLFQSDTYRINYYHDLLGTK